MSLSPKLLKTSIKIYRELYWKPKYVFSKWLYSYTGFDLLTFRKLAALRNKHLGERVIVIGNGPSLSSINLDSLSCWTTFASNKIFLIFEKTEWRPTYYTTEDDLVIIQNIERISKKIDERTTVIQPYICKAYKTNIYADIFFAYSFRKFFDRKQHFGADALDCIYNGYSVVYTQIQLAIFMGAKEIALIGVDFNFNTNDARASNGDLIGTGLTNHFIPNYRSIGERWNPPMLDRQELSFSLARIEAEKRGIRIVNCTEGSKLEVFERENLDIFLNNR